MKFLSFIIIILLTSCSLFTNKFDNNEYASYIKLLTLAEETVKVCDSSEDTKKYLVKIQHESNFLVNYTKYNDKNEESYNISTILNKNIKEMVNRYNTIGASSAYCKAKLTIYAKSIQEIAKATTAKQ